MCSLLFVPQALGPVIYHTFQDFSKKAPILHSMKNTASKSQAILTLTLSFSHLKVNGFTHLLVLQLIYLYLIVKQEKQLILYRHISKS